MSKNNFYSKIRVKSGVIRVTQSPPLWNQLKARAQKLKENEGNVLFIILLCVFLFAALSYAVTSSTRSGGGDASREQAQLDAAYIVMNATTIESTIQRLRLSNNCDITQLSFENTAVRDSHEYVYINPNAPSDKSCHLFHPNGGNLSLVLSTSTTPAIHWMGTEMPIWSGNSNIQVCGVGSTGWLSEADQKTDMVLYYKTSKNVCRAINDKLGITSDSNGDPPARGPGTGSLHYITPNQDATVPFVWNGQTLGHCNASGQPTGFWFGYSQGCQKMDFPSAPAYYYFHVIIAR